MPRLKVRRETWPIRGVFRISRGERTASEVVVAEVEDGDHRGRGECVPYPRYGESVAGVVADIEQLTGAIAGGLDREGLQATLPAGAARNALDCALWDLEAKRRGTSVWRLAGLPEPVALTTAYTISLGAPEEMRDAAREQAHRPLLKLKLTGAGDMERVQAVRGAAPDSRIIADANEAWSPRLFAELSPVLAELGVEMLEQPLAAGQDTALSETDHPIPVCADEACHTSHDVPALADRYDLVNVKLDKTGGLTEAIALVAAAREAGLNVMLGCMVGTSLSIAPAVLLGWAATYVDLDAPLLLAEDRPEGLRFEGSVVYPPGRELWG
ncbi:MAG: L-Ala-D/L-Glu epimerase [Gemmatimonadales bacterium]|nr:L-Ala-D/L-Glu epimerase [Gemmatimonadales bacterium]NIN12980.1 L-Ala-D/L-Glu epimerase [Gemmatimonadales bacterium]NIN51057.1 L-Ala-D/L-Glu epimerase [Gemmatimonadales bacterium]NIP08521.1 L-Ala-D/L-Glu epimerase [Gemmatimonadales bacterium]NIR02239.1 L-Ala-D/L-Glu epimerase [Gemmatimonadales bacterium]